MMRSRADIVRPTVVDVFCGAGGLSLGFRNAGFEIVAAFDGSEAALATHRRNVSFETTRMELSFGVELPKATVVIGGPPCQGFSSAGPRRPDDVRNTLVGVFADIVVRHKPLAFVFENVEGFLTADEGRFVLDLLEPVIAAGYHVHLRKINAANYGVPQLRKRVVAIGMLGRTPTFPAPVNRAYGAPGAGRIGSAHPPALTVSDALAGLPDPMEDPPGVPPDHYIRPIGEEDRRRISALSPGQTMRDLPEHFWHKTFRRRAYRRVMDGTPTEKRGGAPAGIRRLRPDEPSKAITTGARTELVHPSEDRYLTLRECARIQTFPDEFVFYGTQSERALQIGNAVPPRLAEIIAVSLRNDIAAYSFDEAGGAGKLASFIPTLSEGMSPALLGVSEAVRRRFSIAFPEDQLALWD